MRPKSFVVLSMILFWISANSGIYSQGIGLVYVKHAEQVITVGGPDADVPGFTSEAIQIAIDAIRTRGGGIVKLNTGVGIFLCWRVQNGIFRNNSVYANSASGISIGHKDTDNIFENNHVFENGKHGVAFRNETE